MKNLLLTFLIAVSLFACKKEDKASLASVTTTTASNVTSTGLTTGGNITSNGGSDIMKRGIAWATHTAPTVGDSITIDGGGNGNFVSTLANLNANTTYYIRAYAANAAGTAYGNEITVTTSNGLATISTTPISDIQPLSAKSGGNISNDGGASVTERGVVYATMPNPTTANLKITAGSGTGIFIAALSPLASQQTYYVRAYATNSYGTAYGSEVQFNAASANTITDIEGNVYPYLTIGSQIWMATNLKVTKFRNGDPITDGTAITYNWYGTTEGAYAFPNAQAAKKDTFGLLYNMQAVRDSRNICPAGWHLPTDDEWKILEMNQGMTQTDADLTGPRGTIAQKLKQGGSSGLNLQLGGYILRTSPASGTYLDYGAKGFFYSNTVWNSTSNWYRSIYIAGDANEMAVNRSTNRYVMSVRCVKD
jgi:uncharacterized protein (TIGR02145 family)